MSTSKMAQVVNSTVGKVVASRQSIHPIVEVKDMSGKTVVRDARQIAYSQVRIPLDIKWSPATLVPSTLTQFFSNGGLAYTCTCQYAQSARKSTKNWVLKGGRA